MQLKRYQERTLGVIKNFFEKAQSMTPAAYQLVTEDLDVQPRLGKLRKYVEVDGNVPKVAVKVPTGGGKTIIAVEAIRVIGEAFGINYPFVLWFTPSDAITRQTVEALKRTTHPYRQELERVFGNNVRVYGIDEKFTITPSDLDENVKLAFDDQFAFDKDIYKNELAMMKFYGGGDYVFTKHFLGLNRIPQFDGQKANGEGEVYECAKRIDQNPKVKCWLRNVASKVGSFGLPVSNGWFYPDFIGSLEDGRLFVVEYKGADRKSNADTIEKDAIGRLWASRSDGRCLYRTVYKEDAGKDAVQQLNELFA